MRALALVFVLLLFVTPAFAQTILFEEGFEPGFDGTGWSGGMGVVDQSLSYSGVSCLRLDGGTGNEIMSWDLGEHPADGIFEAWFYDDLQPDLETHVSVRASDQHLSTSSVHLRIGTSCEYSRGYYIAVEGWHSSGLVVRGPARSEGWHKAEFRSVGGSTELYLDGQPLHTTTFQGAWRYLILNEDNHCTGTSWFDDVAVWREEPVSVEPSAWGAIKSLYGGE